MKIVTFVDQEQEKLGILLDHSVIACQDLSPQLPNDMKTLLDTGDLGMKALRKAYNQFLANPLNFPSSIPMQEVVLLAPVPKPNSFRDAYAFRQHVETSRANRGLDMIPEFDQFPVFYFSNHQAIFGPGTVPCMPDHFDHLDFELEVAIVINKTGKNIKAKDADQYIAGFMILNDLSARTLQMQEMKLNLGPAKGKDFASAFGPYMLSIDSLNEYIRKPKAGHIGNVYDLQMCCRVNGIQVSEGNLADMHWTFAEIIERISYGVTLFPGDIIGSGTVGTGCFLELNGTGLRNDPNYQTQWLQQNDIIEMQVTALGTLTNKVILDTDIQP